MNTNSQATNPTQSQQAWASTVSDYILMRRQQTTTAYTPADNKPSTQINSSQTTDDWLFKTIFTILAKQLEEGHTVLTLSASANDDEGRNTALNNDLYAWQRQLLTLLAQPLFELIDDATGEITIAQDRNNINELNDSDNNDSVTHQDPFMTKLNTIMQQGEQLWQPLELSHHERQLLKENYHLVEQLHDFILLSNQSQNSLSSSNNSRGLNSLSDFIAKVKNHPLMSAMITPSDGGGEHDSKNSLNKNSLSKNYPNESKVPNYQNNKPIIYKVSHSIVSPEILDNAHIDDADNPPTSITFWLQRTWQAEHTLAKRITAILASEVEPLPLTLPDTLNEQQIHAINIANNNALSIITGGPGTGKTYTVAQLVIALHQAGEQKSNQQQDTPKFSSDSASLTLAAPTGKAAQRMQESLQAVLDNTDSDANITIKLEEAKTIHRLLGIGRDGRPRYHADNPLGEDVIIIDEASMLGVELANHLVSSIKSGARLILLGDANQLAAVDAGAVLSDLRRIPILQPIHATLTQSRRFDKESGIGKLAESINQDKVDLKEVWRLLNQDKALNFRHINTHKSDNNVQAVSAKNSLSNLNNLNNKQLLNKICTNYQPFLNKVAQALPNGINYKNEGNLAKPSISPVETAQALIKTLNKFRVLCAGHHGQWGDDFINDYLTDWHISSLKLPLGSSAWFHGRPVMILHNSYELGLFNGDIGICLQIAGSSKLEVFFENKTQGIAVNLLNDDLITTAYAMTIHKSQGSEFDHVTITFDSAHSRLLSKELIYTAVTRAKKQVTIYSSKSALEQAVTTPTVRQTGLALQFAE